MSTDHRTLLKSKMGRTGRIGQLALLIPVLLVWITQSSYGQNCATPPDGLVAWWQAESNALDYTGNNNGTLNGIAFTSGEVGTAFYFSGNANVRIPDAPNLRFTSAMTVEAWVYPTNLINGQAYSIVVKADSPGVTPVNMAYVLGFSGGAPVYFTCYTNGTGSSGVPCFSTDLLPANQWTHVAATYDGTYSLLYFNGQLEGAVAFSGGIYPGTDDLGIGGNVGGLPPGGVAAPFSGLIDEVSLYSRALSQAEIQSIYNAGTSGKCQVPVIASQPTDKAGFIGGNVTFTVGASGQAPLSFQWSENGVPLSFGTNSSLTLTNLQPGESGNYYSVLVSNILGTAQSLNATLTVTAPPACATPPASLVSWWQAESNALDYLSSDNGALFGGATFASGEVGSGFVFNGNAQGVSLGNPPNLHLQDLTIECWVKRANSTVTSGAGGGGIIFGFGDGGYNLFLKNGGPPGLSETDIDAVLSDGPTITDLNFHHLAVTKSGNTVVFYVDGVASSALSYGSTFTFGAPAAIGMQGDNHQNSFWGTIDELAVYNGALSASDIQAIYNAGIVGKCQVPIITSQPLSLTNYVGSNVTFSVTAGGKGPLSYLWSENGNPLISATNSSLTISNLQLGQSGNHYSILVSNGNGSTQSTNATLTVNLPPPCTAPPSGLVSWWQGERDPNDGMGTNNGQLQNGVTFSPGEVGQAFNFDGTNGLVSVPASTTMDVGAGGGLTLECWIKPADVLNGHIICEWNDAISHSGMQLWFSLQGLGGVGAIFVNFVDTSGNSHFLETGNIVNTNGFQHVAVTYDKASGVERIYYNGIVQVALTNANLRLQTTYGFYIGKRVSAGAASPYQGLLDELSLYNRALTSAEIQNIYNSGASGKCVPQVAAAIVGQPQGVTASPGATATFKVAALGGHAVNYQWQLNGSNIGGATNNPLVLTNVQPDDSGGFYSVVVSNAYGQTNSSSAQLKVKVVNALANGQLLTNSVYTFGNSAMITLSNFYPAGDIFYTLDGSQPTFGSILYNGPFVINQSSVLRTLGYSPDFSQSAVSDPITIQIVPTYNLTTTSAGGGRIAVSPTNNAPYPGGTLVNITATPSNGWTFLQWLGDAAGASTNNTVLMTRNKSVQAVFGTTVGNTASGGGSVIFNPLGGVYPFGTALQASAVPQPGNVFVLWGNAASGSTNPLSFIVTNPNPVISSLFTSLGAGQAALTVVPVGHGHVSVNPRANGYATNASVTITATPDAGKLFNGWSGDANGTQNPLTVTMTTSKIIYANFSTNNSLSAHLTSGGFADGFQVDLNGEFGTHYRLDVSSNLFDWTPLTSGTNQEGIIHYIDTNAAISGRRFYRSVILP